MRCSMGVFLDDLEEQGKAIISRALENTKITTSAIIRAIEKRVGADSAPSRWAVRIHRHKDCSCYR